MVPSSVVKLLNKVLKETNSFRGFPKFLAMYVYCIKHLNVCIKFFKQKFRVLIWMRPFGAYRLRILTISGH